MITEIQVQAVGRFLSRRFEYLLNEELAQQIAKETVQFLNNCEQAFMELE